MTLSPENKALLERTAGWDAIQEDYFYLGAPETFLNRLIDAAKAEGRDAGLEECRAIEQVPPEPPRSTAEIQRDVQANLRRARTPQELQDRMPR